MGYLAGAAEGLAMRPGIQITAGVLTLAIIVAGRYLPWQRLPVRAQTILPLAYLFVVVLLRESGPMAATVYVPLIMLPVFWFALYGSRGELGIVLVGVALVFVAPVAIAPGGISPDTETRLGLVWLAVTMVVGFTVQSLVASQRRMTEELATSVAIRRRAERAAQESEQVLKAVSEVARGVAVSDDARETICTGALEMGRADMAMLLEHDGDGQLVMTARAGFELEQVRIRLGEEASGAAVAFTSGQRFFVPDAASSPAVSQRLRKALGITSVAFEPIRHEDRPIGVLATGWCEPMISLEGPVGSALHLLALEAGAAIERSDMLRRLEQMASTDGLTGLLNRRAWDEALSRETSRARRSGEPLCLALIDLDHFKDFNDECGHQAGDRLLKAAAAAWRGALREVDLLARYGGEEFAVLLPGCGVGEARSVLERVREATPAGITCSAGVAQWDMAEKADAWPRAPTTRCTRPRSPGATA